MSENLDFLKFIEDNSKRVREALSFAVDCGMDGADLPAYDRLINHLDLLKNVASQQSLSSNHINQFSSEINELISLYPSPTSGKYGDIEHLKTNFQRYFESSESDINHLLVSIEFNFDFFNKLGFFKNNVVAVGANGSGKTSLSNELKQYLPSTGVVISAQKLLVIPTFSGISNYEKTDQKLQQTQTADKSLKTTFSTENNGNAYQILVQLGGEFQILLDNLLAEKCCTK